MNSDKCWNRPPHLVSLFHGLYSRVAQRLGVHPSYVSRVARGDRESEAVTAALKQGNMEDNRAFREPEWKPLRWNIKGRG